MSDSFFTARNHFDPQIEAQRWDATSCNLMLEAAARRLAKLDGPIEASKRLQRVADICAGAYVLPMDHWAKLGNTKAEPSPAPAAAEEPLPRWLGMWRSVVGNPSVVFWSGFLLGVFWEARWR